MLHAVIRRRGGRFTLVALALLVLTGCQGIAGGGCSAAAPIVIVPPPGTGADFFVLTNRQKVIGLPAYFKGVEYDSVAFTITQPPAHGMLLGTAPNLTYVPDADYTGDDSFTYRATAGANSLERTLIVRIADDFVPPIGIPPPEFGITQSHRMYTGQMYDFNGSMEAYRDAGNGPYTHYVDFNAGSDAGNPFGTHDNPRKTLPDTLTPGSVVELHGTGFNSQLRYIIRGSGTAEKPIFIRGADAKNKPVFRRPFGIEGNFIICENLEFDCQDFGTGMQGPVWFWVTNAQQAPFDVFHHIALRHSLFRDQPTNIGQNPVAASVGVSSQIPSLNNATSLIEHVVMYDVEVRNFSQWNDFTGNEDYGGFMIAGNSRDIWMLDCHVHHVRGDAVGVSRSNAASLQTAARNVYLGRNYLHHCKESAVDFKNGVDCVFSQNLCHTFRVSNSSPGHAVSIHDDDPVPDWPASHNIWVIFNTIYDSEIGVFHENFITLPLGRSSRSYILGNLIWDVRRILGSAALKGVAIQKGQMAESRIVGNLIYDCDHGIWIGLSSLTDPGRAACVARNNVIVELTERYFNDFGEHGMHVFITPDTLVPFVTLDHNLHYESVGSVRFVVAKPGLINAGYLSVADLLADTGLGADSVQADPQWTSPATFDFHPAADSPLVDAGVMDDIYATFESAFGFSIRYDHDGRNLPIGGANIGPLEAAN